MDDSNSVTKDRVYLTSEAQRRAMKKYQEANKEKILQRHRQRYHERMVDPQFAEKMRQISLKNYYDKKANQTNVVSRPRGRPRKNFGVDELLKTDPILDHETNIKN